MVKFKTLVFTSLILAFLINIVPYTTSATTINELTILLKLIDGEPLSNAVVKVAPSIYSSRVVENSTDENGLVKLYNVNVASYYTTYQFYLSIWYGFYGSIANMSLRVNQIQSVFIEITLPFKRLDISLNVTNEYLNPVNGTYQLYYPVNNLLLIQGDFTNGYLKLSKPVVNGYMLLQRSSGDIIVSSSDIIQVSNKQIMDSIRYRLDIYVNGYSEVITIPSSTPSTNLVIDIYPPRILDVKSDVDIDERLQIAWIYVIVNATDGVYTKDLKLEYRITMLTSGEKICENIPYNKNTYENYAVFTIKCSKMLTHLKDEKMLIIEIILIDRTGKKTENTTYCYLVSRLNESMNTTIGEIVNAIPQQSSSGSESVNVNTPVSRGVDIGGEGYFDIPREEKVVGFNVLFYLTGIIISSLILIGEIKRNRVKQ